MIASSLIDVSALWKILLVGLAGGAGVVVAFGFVLLGRSRYEAAGEAGGVKAGAFTIAVLGGAFCIAALVLGFVAMTHK
jgi:hypothetical protein